MCSTRSTDLEVCPTRPTDLEAWPWLTWLTLSVRLACACARVVGVGPPGWPWGVSHSPVWLWRVTPSPGCPWGMTSDSPGWSWPCAWRVRARRWFRLCAAPAEPPAPRASAAPPGSPAEPSRSHTPSPGQIVRKLIRPEWRWWTAIVSYNANSHYHILTIPSNLDGNSTHVTNTHCVDFSRQSPAIRRSSVSTSACVARPGWVPSSAASVSDNRHRREWGTGSHTHAARRHRQSIKALLKKGMLSTLKKGICGAAFDGKNALTTVFGVVFIDLYTMTFVTVSTAD